MTHKPNKRLILTGAIVLALVLAISSTFAWFTANATVKNRLATKDGLANVKPQEVFVEPDDWKPGQKITKEVSAINTGSAPALVRFTFEEFLKINLPAGQQTNVFDSADLTAKKRPVLIDGDMFPHGPTDEWFEVTTTPNAAKGGIMLAADYSPAKVYAKHNTAGSTDSYSFIVWAEITGTGSSYDGKLQEVYFERTWDSSTKTLSLDTTTLRYMTYQGEVEMTADWAGADTALADVWTAPTPGSISIAEEKLNTDVGSSTEGHYPNYIEMQYAHLTATPTANN